MFKNEIEPPEYLVELVRKNLKKSNKEDCDHWLGILNSYNQTDENNLYFDDYIKKLHQLHEISIELAKHNMARAPIFSKSYLDRRQGFSTLFDFCPVCGAKLNWKELRRALDE